MTIKIITAAALTLALAGSALAQDSKPATGGATPAPAVKVEAPKITTPAVAPVTAPAVKVEAPKVMTPVAAPTATPAAKTSGYCSHW